VDPNVLISAAISAVGAPRELLVAWYTGRFEMIVSYDLLYELEAVLMRPRFRRKLTFSDVVEYVMWIRERATFVPDVPPWRNGWWSRSRTPTTPTSLRLPRSAELTTWLRVTVVSAKPRGGSLQRSRI
jgi:hypothetical protein